MRKLMGSMLAVFVLAGLVWGTKSLIQPFCSAKRTAYVQVKAEPQNSQILKTAPKPHYQLMAYDKSGHIRGQKWKVNSQRACYSAYLALVNDDKKSLSSWKDLLGEKVPRAILNKLY